MGYWASPEKDLGPQHLTTNNGDGLQVDKPFCNHEYSMRLLSNSLPGQRQARGQIHIYLKRGDTTTALDIFDDADNTLKADGELIKFMSSYKLVTSAEPIHSVYLSYTKTSNLLSSWMYDSAWAFRYIEVTSGDDQTTVKFCPVDRGLIPSGKFAEYLPC